MRIANHDNRAVIVAADGIVDVFTASHGQFGPEIEQVYRKWGQFHQWLMARDGRDDEVIGVLDPARLAAPSPQPRQVFAIALNYLDHVEEGGFSVPTSPGVFTKFQTSITGPEGDIVLPDGDVDWEIELVVIIGKAATQVAAAQAWDHVAGLTIGQDLSERRTQHRPPAPQFSLGKSFPGFSPTGPWLSTLDEFDDLNDLALRAFVNGELVQDSRTSQMIFNVPTLIEFLSRHVTLLPGDTIYTGTPAGVGKGRNPPRFLKVGDLLRSEIPGLGSMTHTMIR